ncbi:MAG: RsmE family RNA methyltransferase [Clostridia bacterium]
MARRFIVNENDIQKNIELNENIFEITGNEVKHIQVLRKNVGDIITINECICKIIQMKKISIILEKIDIASKVGEPGTNLTLYMAMLKGDKMELVIQKAVELGVKKIVPFLSKNVIVKLDEKGKFKKIEKFQKIANEACKQCGRTDSVTIESICCFSSMINSLKNIDINIFAYEKATINLYTVMNNLKYDNKENISIIVGPEGGFDNSEASLLKEVDTVYPISLGGRILRAETAAISTISIIMYELEN